VNPPLESLDTKIKMLLRSYVDVLVSKNATGVPLPKVPEFTSYELCSQRIDPRGPFEVTV
jgi:hypothetical protein